MGAYARATRGEIRTFVGCPERSHTTCTPSGLRDRSGIGEGAPGTPGSATKAASEQLLGLFRALAALVLGPAEEVRELGVAGAVSVLNVGFQTQRVAYAGLGEPDDCPWCR